MNRYFDMHFNKNIVTLHPGEFWATGENEMISTVLGSCVSIVLFDAIAGIGGMNHFMLAKDTSVDGSAKTMDVGIGLGRFGEYAMEMLVSDMTKKGASLERCQAKVFGGGNIFGVADTSNTQVGKANIEFAFDWLKTNNVEVISSDVGGNLPRKLFFDPKTFKVFLKHINNAQHNDDDYLRKQEEEGYLKTLRELAEMAKKLKEKN